MNLIQQLSEACPRWRLDISPDPIDAALELGLIDDDPRTATAELDFNAPGVWDEMEDTYE